MLENLSVRKIEAHGEASKNPVENWKINEADDNG